MLLIRKKKKSSKTTLRKKAPRKFKQALKIKYQAGTKLLFQTFTHTALCYEQTGRQHFANRSISCHYSHFPFPLYQLSASRVDNMFPRVRIIPRSSKAFVFQQEIRPCPFARHAALPEIHLPPFGLRLAPQGQHGTIAHIDQRIVHPKLPEQWPYLLQSIAFQETGKVDSHSGDVKRRGSAPRATAGRYGQTPAYGNPNELSHRNIRRSGYNNQCKRQACHKAPGSPAAASRMPYDSGMPIRSQHHSNCPSSPNDTAPDGWHRPHAAAGLPAYALPGTKHKAAHHANRKIYKDAGAYP